MIAGLCVLSAVSLPAADQVIDNRAKHKEGAAKVAQDQDELAADVQQLVIEQTLPNVIQFFTEAKNIMNEATDLLDGADTGGATMAAQTEVIEKIHAAAKAKQQQSGDSKAGGAMLDMMERMMGKGEGEKSGKGEGEKSGKGDKPGGKSGQGQNGLSDAANDTSAGAANGRSETRRVPKAAGNATLEIPEEFRKAFDAYNRGAEKKVK